MKILQLIAKEAVINLNHAVSFSTVVPEGQHPYIIEYVKEMNCFRILSNRKLVVYIPMSSVKEFVVEDDKPVKKVAA